MKILIVEDDAASRLFLRAFLKRYGDTRVAEDGRVAVREFRAALEEEELFDLVCLDVMMPEMDGREALQEMRRAEEENDILPSERATILMVTAINDPESIMREFPGMCDGYVPKPVDRARLLEKLKELELIES